jgi:alginate O-acetyltransferase complex protein AlgI
MVFSSPIFLFLFLPVTLGLYFLLPSRLRNAWLLGMSLAFYGWGEPKFLVVMLASIVLNFLLALWIDRLQGETGARPALAMAVVLNIGVLVFFKYANFIVDNLNSLLGHAGFSPILIPEIGLPIGISFFTFHALSYVIDVYRRQAAAQRNPLDMGLYIALFPQLVAGPIIRYHDIAYQLHQRVLSRADFAYGVERFVIGLGKKVLIANTLAGPADLIFSIPSHQLTTGVAWLGVLCYSLQIYFDFSGYSDMAIGLGRMFGFRFLENFNYPYISRSVTEFWHRWHISLSTWFRDYLYIPLGGSRVTPWRVYLNLVTVFFLCGLWHGASWNFVIWGLFHGTFLVLERMGLSGMITRSWGPLRHIYVLLVVMVSWVFFRSATLGEAWGMLGAMAGFATGSGMEQHVSLYLDAEKLLVIGAGVLGSAAVGPLVRRWCEGATSPVKEGLIGLARVAAMTAILMASSMLLAAGTYNPFIYFRF